MDRLYFFTLVLVGILIILFFPIFLDTHAHIDVNRRKFSFIIYAFKRIKLIGGYIATYAGGLAIHISDTKAILIPYSQLDSERKRFSFIKTFRLQSFLLTTETGADYLLPIGALQMLLRGYFFLRGGKKANIENNLWLTDGDILRISLSCRLFFNMFILLKSLLKFLKEKIKILWRKKIKNLTV